MQISKTGKVAPVVDSLVENNAAWHTSLSKVVEMPGTESVHMLGRRGGSSCEVQTEAYLGPQPEYLRNRQREGHHHPRMVFLTAFLQRSSEVPFK